MRLRTERMVRNDCLRCPHVLGGGFRRRTSTSTGRCQRCVLVRRALLIRLFRDGEEA
jgi:hypothetical protein